MIALTKLSVIPQHVPARASLAAGGAVQGVVAAAGTSLPVARAQRHAALSRLSALAALAAALARRAGAAPPRPAPAGRHRDSGAGAQAICPGNW